MIYSIKTDKTGNFDYYNTSFTGIAGFVEITFYI